jgi:TatD DNase family protein
MFIDTHTHLYGDEFKDDIDEVVARAQAAGAGKLFLPATDLPSAEEACRLSRRYPGVCYPMLGLHPEDLPDNYSQILDSMEQLLKQPHPYIGIGEVGLDFYWDSSKAEQQCEAFSRQAEWSLRYGLPLMIHFRGAQQALVDCLTPFGKDRLSGVFHCFSGTADEAAKLLEFPHFKLGIGGIVTFKKSKLPEALKQVPLRRIVLETDAPYMAPVPFRGRRNEPSFLPSVIQKLAEVYGTTTEKVMEVTTANALETFPAAR